MKREKNDTLGQARSIDEFVETKLERFGAMEHNFASLFTFMFSEQDNVLYERSNGLSIEKITYGQAQKNALKKAAALKDMLSGLPADTPVGLWMDNGPEWIESFWAILCAGFRPMLLNVRLDEKSVKEAIKSTQTAAVISDRETFTVKTIRLSELDQGEVELKPETFGSELLLMSSGTSANVKICAYTAEEIYHQVRDSYQIIRQCAKVKGFYH